MKTAPAMRFFCGQAEITDGNVEPDPARTRHAPAAPSSPQNAPPRAPCLSISPPREPLRRGRSPLKSPLEIGYGVPAGARAEGALQVKTLPPMKCACVTHH